MFRFLFTLLLFSFLGQRAQVFPGTGGSITNGGGAATEFSLNVTSLTAPIDSVYGLEEVCLDITHPTVEELHIFLRSPSGIEVELTGMKSLKGINFTSTCFNHAMANSITLGVAPYTGNGRPVGNIGRFNRQLPGNGKWTLVVEDFTAGPNSGTLNSWSLKFSNNPGKPVVLSSSNLPLVFIDTPGGQVLTDSNVTIDFGIIYNGLNRNYFTDPKNHFSGKASCHIRGASSRMFEKNNLKIELKDQLLNDLSAPLLGMPSESDWILTATYTDKTMIRNPLSQHLFRSMGRYSPRDVYVELIVNGEYYGVYILMEQIKRGTNRVNIAKMEISDNQFPEITGGYILQIDRVNEPGWYSLNAGVSANGAKFFIQYNYPKSDVITLQQKDYIKAVVDSFETVMASSGFADPQTGYRAFIDDDSFIDYLIVNELSKNVDAYKLSSYFYKAAISQGGKIYSGPVWDFDLAWYNCNFGNAFDETGWQHVHNNSSNPIPTWWKRLMEDPAFQNKLHCRYHLLRKTILSDSAINLFIDEKTMLLSEARVRNFKQFPIIGAYIYANPQNQTLMTYDAEVAELKSWVNKRGKWLDINIPGDCSKTSLESLESMKFSSYIFPNPAMQSVSVLSTSEIVRYVEFYNTLGQLVHKVNVEKDLLPGTPININIENLKAGTYSVIIRTDKSLSTHKLLKMDQVDQ